MKRITLIFLFNCLFAAQAPADESAASSVSGSSTAVPQACQDTPTTPCAPPPPAWQAELEKAQKAWTVCQKDIDQFCEGIQVGEGRLENCLKAHKKKLSQACRKAQGLK